MSEVVVNIDALKLDAESKGSRFAMACAGIGDALGLKWLGATVYEVPPGKTAMPFHRHHTADEMFLILSGTGEYRYGERRLPVGPLDCLGAPAAGEAHQIINTGDVTLRYIAFSNNNNADVVEYPDSGRVRIDVGATGLHEFNGTFKRGGLLTPLGYWDGEDIEGGQ